MSRVRLLHKAWLARFETPLWRVWIGLSDIPRDYVRWASLFEATRSIRAPVRIQPLGSVLAPPGDWAWEDALFRLEVDQAIRTRAYPRDRAVTLDDATLTSRSPSAYASPYGEREA